MPCWADAFGLYAAQINFAVRLPVAVKHAAASPGKMTAAGRIAGAKLHAVESLAVVGRGQIRP